MQHSDNYVMMICNWQGEDLTTYGELVAEGAFRMYGAKAPRHVFLLDRMLLICKRKEHDSSTLVYKAHIMCSNLMLIESVPGEPHSFHVIPFDSPLKQYTLEVSSGWRIPKSPRVGSRQCNYFLRFFGII